jgi:ribosome-binding protein aMBF1 (putative translation factor)
MMPGMATTDSSTPAPEGATANPAPPRRDSPVRNERVRAGLTQAALAERSGLAISTISAVERAPGLLSDRVAYRIAGALGIARAALVAAANH